MPVQKGFVGTTRRDNRGVSLRKWRQWFDGEDQDEGEGQGAGDDPATIEDAKKLITALRKRINDKVSEKDTVISTLNERLANIERAQKKKLEDEGNYKSLKEQAEAEAESLRGYKDRATALEQVIRESNDSRIKALPEGQRDLVPADYPPEKLQAWLNKNEARLVKPAAPNFDAGAGGNGGSGAREEELTADEKTLAAATGMTPKQFLTAKAATAKK